MPESKTSTDIFIQQGEEAIVSASLHEYVPEEKETLKDEDYNARNVSITIDNPTAMLELSLPIDVAKKLIEKVQEVLEQDEKDPGHQPS